MELLQEEIYDHTSDSAQESFRNQQYQRSSMQRSVIVDRLRREGCRITKQRKSYSISFFRKNAHVVRKFIFLHRRRIRISEWQQFTE